MATTACRISQGGARASVSQAVRDQLFKFSGSPHHCRDKLWANIADLRWNNQESAISEDLDNFKKLTLSS